MLFCLKYYPEASHGRCIFSSFSLLYVSGSTSNLARFAIPSAVCDLPHTAIGECEEKQYSYLFHYPSFNLPLKKRGEEGTELP